MVAILLALTVNFLAGQVKTHYDVLSAVADIRSEMTSNDALVRRLHPHHLAKCGVLQNLARRGREHKISYTSYQNAIDTVLPFVPPAVDATAWNLANASGVSANFDYATRADIARVYAQQESFERLTSELAVDFRPLIFTRDADFFLVARNAALDCTYVTIGEDRLGATYHDEIRKMR